LDITKIRNWDMRRKSLNGVVAIGCTTTIMCLASSALAADAWFAIGGKGQIVHENNMHEVAPTVAVDAADFNGIATHVNTHGLGVSITQTAGGAFVTLDWPDAAFMGEVGHPSIPVLRQLFVAPQGARVNIDVQPGMEVQINLAELGYDMPLMPVQAPIEKLPGARERAPFAFDKDAYTSNEWTPSAHARVYEVGMQGEARLMMLEMYPVAYLAQSNHLLVYPDMQVDVNFVGGQRFSRNMRPGMNSLVLNPQPRDKSRSGRGNYLIIVHSDFSAGIAAFAAAKQAQGYDVTTEVVTGNPTTTSVKSIIQGWYDPSELCYVLLVGDTDWIPCWTGSGEGSPDTDLNYAQLSGSDYAPDLALGRFSCRNATDLQAIVDKTLYVQAGAFSDPDYMKRAVFMASEDNYTVSEGTHNWVIDNYLDPLEFDCMKLYCHTYSASTAQVSAAINGGRIWTIYSGHGGTTSWADGPPFSFSNIDALTNQDKYPFIWSFACVTGSYDMDTCFTEYFSRAVNKGAATIYGSSVNSYWTEDDILEKVLYDAFYDEVDPVYTIGDAWVDTLDRYYAHFGESSTTRRYFEMYNLMGDPSMPLPGSCSDAGLLSCDSAKYACEDDITLLVSDCGLNGDPLVAETVFVNVASDSNPTGYDIMLTENGPNTAKLEGSVPISAAGAGGGSLLVSAGDTITITYIDEDDGGGGTMVPVIATATVDCQSPSVVAVSTIDIEPRAATVQVDADEVVSVVAKYGVSCGALTQTTAPGGFGDPPVVNQRPAGQHDVLLRRGSRRHGGQHHRRRQRGELLHVHDAGGAGLLHRAVQQFRPGQPAHPAVPHGRGGLLQRVRRAHRRAAHRSRRRHDGLAER
jgi:hypothetical protein